MSEHTSWPHGTPSWTDNASPDPGAAAEFYKGLFGWEAADVMPPDSPGRYLMCTLRGKSVAACGPQPAEGVPPVWNTYITVDDVDQITGKVTGAGGAVLMEAFDAMDAGRMAMFTDPSGAAFMCWQPKNHIGAEIVNEPGAMTWNELLTRDVDGAKAFYGAVFGWTTTAMEIPGGEYTIWHRPDQAAEQGVGGMLAISEGMPAGMPPNWMVYFAVEDADATAAKAQDLGGGVMAAPFDISVGRIAVLTDPQGAAFSVIKPNPPGESSS